ncbi:MAG TPA: transglycosylase SLT domain-containing protein [Baekduia sp.]|uniref:M15 family metallopeptidase n=1 Tax=Baekduia sp. TaxID=2600305 RepID=UPI002B671A17|nr:transglycosylase SLT domain-containing protein [Baekduia sp.]HMJ33603.1 transglycosylase SLT domain-containing protein [Baekduia sp.]
MLRGECGQATLLLLGVLLAVLVGAGVLGALARGLGAQQERRGAADLAALAGAEAMRAAQPRLFEPAELDHGVPNPRHLERTAYLALGRTAAVATARRNGARRVAVAFPDAGAIAPNRIAVTVRDPIRIAGREVVEDARAVAEIASVTLPSAGGDLSGEYAGPLATRQGKRMRPDVALAFDRMSAAARAGGVTLIVTSAFRGNAEQAALFAAHPDPKWVARPGTSLHRLGTELDLGPASAYPWLAAHAPRFGFKLRYNWEPWHFGYTRAAGSRSVGFGPGDGRSGLPSFVPARWAPAIGRAAQRWNVGAALLAAQLYQESGFNPFARSSAGALGLAQFMPGTAKDYNLTDPLDGDASIMAQAHLMHDLLAQFGSVPLALAAYNAGAGAVAACGCIPSFPETVAYVAEILGLLGGTGDPAAAGTGLQVRLIA